MDRQRQIVVEWIDGALRRAKIVSRVIFASRTMTADRSSGDMNSSCQRLGMPEPGKRTSRMIEQSGRRQIRHENAGPSFYGGPS